MRVALAILALFSLVTVVQAQDPEAERLEKARQMLREFETRTRRLPEPPGKRHLGLPVPRVDLLDLLRAIETFCADHEDLDLAPGADLLAAKTARAVGDPTRALDHADHVLKNDQSVKPQKIAARELRAEILLRLGHQAGAAVEFEALATEFADDRRKSDWANRAEEAKRLAARTAGFAAAIDAGLRQGDGMRMRAEHRLRRFVVDNPLAPKSREFLEHLAAGFTEETPIAAQLPVLERIALHAPKSNLWGKAALLTAREMAREGEYEKALLHAHRMMARPDRVPASAASLPATIDKQVRPFLRRVAGRRLDLEPVTKGTRLADIRKRSGRGDPVLVAELAEGFLEDYPGASEADEIRLILARNLGEADPDQALSLLKQVASRKAGERLGYEALLDAVVMAEEIEGPEAAEALYAAHAQDYPDPARGAPLAIARARLLDGMERWEAARAVLAPWKDKAQGLDKQNLQALDEELAAKIEG